MVNSAAAGTTGTGKEPCARERRVQMRIKSAAFLLPLLGFFRWKGYKSNLILTISKCSAKLQQKNDLEPPLLSVFSYRCA